MKVIIVQRIFSHYRKPVFDRVNDLCDGHLQLLKGTQKTDISESDASYVKKVMTWNYSKSESKVFLWVFSGILKFKPKVVIHEFSLGILSMVPTMIMCKWMGIKVILWGHGYDRKTPFDPKNSLKDKVRIFLLKRADAILLYTQNDKEKLAQYIPREKVFVANNTLNTDKLLSHKNELAREGLEAVKKRLGFNYAYNLVFIGRLLSSKNPTLLLDLVHALPKEVASKVGIHFIGDGEEMEHINQKALKLGLKEHTKMHGAIYDDLITGELLFASDLMVMAGYLGLSVNHALCFNCPVLSFEQTENGPFHSPEVAFVENDKTGYLVENNDLSRMITWVSDYLEDDSKRTSMKTYIEEFAEKEISIDKMVAGFAEAIENVSN